jgi:Family of unknown function (DUF6176)
MQTVATVIKFLPGTEDQRLNWSKTMNARIEEARQSIKSEGVDCESWFTFKINDDQYAFALMRKHDIRVYNTNHPIDLIHKEFKKTWDKKERIPCVTISHFLKRDLLPNAYLTIIEKDESIYVDKDSAKFEFQIGTVTFLAIYERRLAAFCQTNNSDIVPNCLLDVVVENL